MMIDLHMHTKYSDGTDDLKGLLKKCEDKNLEVISITDHNSVMSYFELEKIKIEDYFKGKIITGCEFTINYKQSMIEILGYGLDYRKVGKFLEKYFSAETVNKNSKVLYKRLVCKLNELGFTFKESNFHLIDEDFNTGQIEWKIWLELTRYKENYCILKDDILNDFSTFFRKGITNCNSEIFVNYMEFKPKIEEVIQIIHDSGGLAFLAHPFQYQFCDPISLLDEIVRNYDIDGIECFHSMFTEDKMNYLIEYCKKNGLFISGGSDYHGENKLYELGTGNHNLNIDKKNIENWCINF